WIRAGKPWSAWFRGLGDRQPGGAPRLEPADHVGGVAQAQGLQRGGGQRGGVSLVAADDPGHLMAGGLGNSGRAGRIAAPFTVVAVCRGSAGIPASGTARPFGRGVAEARPAADGLECRNGVEPDQAAASLGEQVVNRGRNGGPLRAWDGRLTGAALLAGGSCPRAGLPGAASHNPYAIIVYLL